MSGMLNSWIYTIKNLTGRTLLRFFVITLILAYGFSVATEYNTLKPIVSDFSTKLISGNIPLSAPGMNQNTGEQITGSIIQYCKTNDKLLIPGYESFTIDCKDVREKGASSALSGLITDTLMKDYYKEYDCSAIGCLANIVFNRRPGDMTFIFSSKMNLFVKSLIPFLALGLLLSIGILVYTIREKYAIFKEVGITLLGAAGIPFLILLLILYKDQILVSTGILSGKEDFLSDKRTSLVQDESRPATLTSHAYLLSLQRCDGFDRITISENNRPGY